MIAKGSWLCLLPLLVVLMSSSLGFGAEAPKPGFEGIPVKREDGRWLALSASPAGFVLSFYDAEKMPEKADAIRATVRWRSPLKSGQQFSVLLANDSRDKLKGNRPVHPPYTFKAILCLVGPSDSVLETYTVDFSPAALPSAGNP